MTEPAPRPRGTSPPRTCERPPMDTGRVDGTPRARRRDGRMPIIIAARFSGDAAKAGWSSAVASKIRLAQGAFARPRRFVE